MEERRIKEEDCLVTLWLLINPSKLIAIEGVLLLEFLKLIFDPVNNKLSTDLELVLEFFL